jgi:exosortase A-associated hydrolase 2
MFFAGNGYRLFGILHQPEGEAAREGFIFCHACVEEKLWAHRVFVSFARELAGRGYAVLRFDFMGHGDSEGAFGEADVSSRHADIDAAVSALRNAQPGLQTVHLLGLRFGATLAALAAERLPGIGRLVLWEPIARGARYMQELLLSNLATQMAVGGKVTESREELVARLHDGAMINVEGYDIALPFFEQTSAIDLLKGPREFAGETLVVQIGKAGQPPRKELQDMARFYRRSEFRQAAEEPFWREIKLLYGQADNLFRETLQWLGRAHG